MVADPDRIATLAGALDHVSIACLLLGSATGPPDRVAALHGPRLEMLLARMLDTTIRGVLYEAAGSVEQALLEGGAEIVRRVCEDSRIPYVLLRADPGNRGAWLRAGIDAVVGLLGNG